MLWISADIRKGCCGSVIWLPPEGKAERWWSRSFCHKHVSEGFAKLNTLDWNWNLTDFHWTVARTVAEGRVEGARGQNRIRTAEGMPSMKRLNHMQDRSVWECWFQSIHRINVGFFTHQEAENLFPTHKDKICRQQSWQNLWRQSLTDVVRRRNSESGDSSLNLLQVGQVGSSGPFRNSIEMERGVQNAALETEKPVSSLGTERTPRRTRGSQARTHSWL